VVAGREGPDVSPARFPRRAPGRLAVFVGGVLLLATPTRALAQACCAAPSLVIPSRLQRHESFGAGLQLRGRGTFGAFGADGAYASSSYGDVEAAQELFASARFLSRAQVALLVPFIETRRRAMGLSEVGGGLGDLRLAGHVELTRAGERAYVPGLALLLGATLPTGTPSDRATGDLQADTTGTGAFEGSAGLEVDQRFERAFVTVAAAVGQRAPREALGVRQSFSPRFTGLVSGGVVLDGDVALGAFATGLAQGPARDRAGVESPDSALALVTAGLAATFPAGDAWRGQATASVDMPVSGWGRNHPTGAGLAVSMLRLWP
jgi:hypothetical protein